MSAAPTIALGILDQSPVRTGGTGVETLHETLALARRADELGYTRYWLAEHHATASLAGPAPEILVTRIAGETETIRVGTGGIMLSHYSPLKVAETFRVLEALYPGRIDLGIGRAPGSDQITAAALGYGSAIGAEYFPARVADMMAFLSGAAPPTEAFSAIDVSPKTSTLPDLWLLGSSDQSALLAAQFGLNFAFAQFITPEGGERIIRGFRQHFRPSELVRTPKTILALFVICAETEAEAARLAKSRDLSLVQRIRGGFMPFPSPEEAEEFAYTDREIRFVAANRSRSLYGNPDQCREILTGMAETYGTNEIMVLTITHDPGARRRSYELLADAFGLSPARRSGKHAVPMGE